MKTNKKHYFLATVILFILFILFTIAVMTIDVRPIGPENSSVGFAIFNGFIFSSLGTNTLWYTITKWLGFIPIIVAIGFALLGIVQWIKRKQFKNIDKNIIVLGIFYILVGLFYVFFERFVVNDRPVLMAGQLEASYPSSHTMLVTCIMTTAIMQAHERIHNKTVFMGINIASILIIVITVIGRLLSGVHWCTDILAGLLLSAALITLYSAILNKVRDRQVTNI